MLVLTSLHDRDDDVRPAGRSRGERSLQRPVVAPGDRTRTPPLDGEPALDAAGPPVRGGLVVDDDGGEPVETEPAGERDRLVVRALVQLGVAEQADDARPDHALGAQRDRHAHGYRQAVPERAARDLDPGDQRAVGVMTERRVEGGERRQRRRGHEAERGQHRVVRGRPVSLREQEAVALRIVGAARVDAQHAVVEHPEDVEGRERRRSVLLVAR